MVLEAVEVAAAEVAEAVLVFSKEAAQVVLDPGALHLAVHHLEVHRLVVLDPAAPDAVGASQLVHHTVLL